MGTKRWALPLAGLCAIMLGACSSGGASRSIPPSTHPTTHASAALATTTSTTAAAQATWQSISGGPYDANNAALLIENTNGGVGTPTFEVVSVSSASTVTINPQTALGSATIDGTENAALVTPSAGRPLGETVVFTSATTPAQGLTPESDNIYVIVYDNKTGAVVDKDELGPRTVDGGAAAPNPIPQPLRDLSLSVVDAVNLSNGEAISQYGAPSWTATNTVTFPNADYASSSQGFGTLIVPMSDSNSGCENLVAVNATTLKQVSTSTKCFPIGGSSVSDSPTSANAYAVSCYNCSGNLTPISIATGQPIALPAALAQDTTICTGPRSTLVGLGPAEYSGGSAAFVDSSTFAVSYTVANTTQLGFSCSGEADNDFWVSTTSGNIVVNSSGQQIASGWKIYPTMGGPGWTVFESTGSATNSPTSWYLLRSSAPAVQAMSSAPNPDDSPSG